ncbi:cytochrome c3 family protein [Chrysiogenes arsenatis]|uniref:cytochrome c3 family protein n=1 Tax=Chrysiogenes arsenatis TaxID=309797 RepID=UPI000419FF5A|nr:cytochrome c3 family protein [Chrysiogenes arsenatis]
MQCHDQPRTRNIPDCLSCHIADKADEMGKLGNNFSNIHTSEFSITHPIAARTNPNLCANCHRENRFCTDCHDKFRRNDLGMESHRRNFSALQTGPLAQSHDQFTEADCKTCHVNSIIPTHEWSTAHAREARKNLATCQACHPSGDTCVKCHSARSGLGISPHPKNWNKIKGRLERASGGATCSRCH